MKDDTATIAVTVQDKFAEHARISDAEVRASLVPAATQKREAELVAKAATDQNGVATFKLAAGTYKFMTNAFGGGETTLTVNNECQCNKTDLEVKLGASVGVTICREDMTTRPCPDLISVGTPIRLTLATQQIAEFPPHFRTTFETTAGRLAPSGGRASVGVRLVEFEKGQRGEAILYTDRLPSGPVRITGRLIEGDGSPTATVFATLNFVAPVTQPITGDVSVTMRRTATFPTPDLPLWIVIRKTLLSGY